jgi:hypothetical protein
MKTRTEVAFDKSTDLSDAEMARGVEHVSKGPKASSYNLLRAEILLIHGPLIHLPQNTKLFLKVTETRRFEITLKKQRIVITSSNTACITYTRVGPKEQINDCILRTGDRLRQAIAIGDGVIVVPPRIRAFFNSIFTISVSFLRLQGNISLPFLRLQGNKNQGKDGGFDLAWVKEGEGSQGQFNIKKTTRGRRRSKTPRFPLIETKVRSYYSLHNSKRIIQLSERDISSKALNDINVYKKAYDNMKSKPGNMKKPSGVDLETLDGMSIRKIEKLRKDIIS